eukprot:SAG25_NODE_35_length_20155_cov_35.583815_1_plen_74_part_00
MLQGTRAALCTSPRLVSFMKYLASFPLVEKTFILSPSPLALPPQRGSGSLSTDEHRLGMIEGELPSFLTKIHS